MKSIALTAATLLALATPAVFAAPAAPASCARVAEQLPELLASAKHRVDSDGEVTAEFEVNAKGHVRPISVDGHRRYRSFVRSALYSLDCSGGTPQRYVLNIRFAEPASTGMAKASGPVIAVTEIR